MTTKDKKGCCGKCWCSCAHRCLNPACECHHPQDNWVEERVREFEELGLGDALVEYRKHASLLTFHRDLFDERLRTALTEALQRGKDLANSHPITNDKENV